MGVKCLVSLARPMLFLVNTPNKLPLIASRTSPKEQGSHALEDCPRVAGLRAIIRHYDISMTWRTLVSSISPLDDQHTPLYFLTHPRREYDGQCYL